MDFYSSIANFLFFFAVISLYFFGKNKKTKISEIENFTNKLNAILNIIIYIILFSFVIIMYWIKIDLKFCFLGSCLVNNKLNYALQILPYKLESVSLFGILMYSLISLNFLKSNSVEIIKDKLFDEKINKNAVKKNNKNSFDEKIEEKINENNIEKIKINKNPNLLNENEIKNTEFHENSKRQNQGKEAFLNGFQKVLIFEIFYFLLISFDSFLKYFKYKDFQLSRFGDYFSIHDYVIIIKGFIIFSLLVLNANNFEEWKKAFNFYDEKILEESNTVGELVDNILYLKSNKLRKIINNNNNA